MDKQYLVKRLWETHDAMLKDDWRPDGPKVIAIIAIIDAISYINTARDDVLDTAWAAVNVLGAPDTACITDRDRAYCQAIGEALSAIEALKSAPNAKEAPGEHKIVAGLKEAVAYAQGDMLQGRETKMYDRRKLKS